MNNLRFPTTLFAAIAVLLQPVSMPLAVAQTTTTSPPPPCMPNGYYFNSFNGINTTVDAAQSNLHALARAYGTFAPSGEMIQYESFYNHTWSAFVDMMETADMRLQEHTLSTRYELMWEQSAGGGPIAAYVRKQNPSKQSIMDWLFTGAESAVAKSLVSVTNLIRDGGNSAAQQADLARHRQRLDEQTATGRKTIFYGHSQGNLYANIAYDYAATRLESNAMRMIHVAPASPTLRGEHTLADRDIVINGLRTFLGSIAPVTSSIPEYQNRPAGLNGDTDIMGHNLQAIYINPRLTISNRIAGHVSAALNDMRPDSRRRIPPFKLKLSWTGQKDLDLDIVEPNGIQVQGYKYIGSAGSLDPTSVTSDSGPEVYTASCSTVAHTGEFYVGFINRWAPEGTPGQLTLETADGDRQTISFVAGKPTGLVSNIQPSTRLATLVYYSDPVSGDLTAVLRK